MSRREARSPDARAEIAAVKAQILEIDEVVRGTLQSRMKVCGKAACRCATDAAAKHGPYFEWGRLAAGKRTSAIVGAALASRLRLALANRRKLERLLRRWEELTLQALRAETDVNRDSART